MCGGVRDRAGARDSAECVLLFFVCLGTTHRYSDLIVKKTRSYLLMVGCAHGAAKTMTQVFKEVWVSS